MRHRITKSPKTVLIMGVLFLAAGLAVVVLMGIPGYQLAKASERWPSTTGLVIESEVIEKAYRTRKKTRKQKTRYSPGIVVEYSVNGKLLRSSRYAISSASSSNPDSAYEVINRYPVGASVPVYYDPQDPSYAVLQKGITGTTWATLLLPLIFVLAGIVMIRKSRFFSGSR